ATACLIPGTPASDIASMENASGNRMSVEHPSGAMGVEIEVEIVGNAINVKRSAFLRTTRKISEGVVFVPEEILGTSKK
ncbi:MAG TPA: 4-oxalomesaconate tautomerase, partial [Nitrospinae bacterium]|nr:4-oxalomesaconate tautomerase [Nitrospinota bacterium]